MGDDLRLVDAERVRDAADVEIDADSLEGRAAIWKMKAWSTAAVVP